MLNPYIIALIILIVGLFIAANSYGRLIRLYNKYDTFAYSNLTAAQFVVAAFNFLGLHDHKIAMDPKKMSDRYAVSKKVVVLSEQNFYSKSISAIAIASHEIGHVMQHKDGSKLFAISFLLQKLSKISDFLLIPSILTGGGLILFSPENLELGNIIFFIGIGLYLVSLMFKLLLIPLEINASKRAISLLQNERILDGDELKGAKKVLSAAALTYIGSLFYGLLSFLRGIGRSFR
ncbi:MAG: zinc metallopeptidase [Spirochaetales bacterium]